MVHSFEIRPAAERGSTQIITESYTPPQSTALMITLCKSKWTDCAQTENGALLTTTNDFTVGTKQHFAELLASVRSRLTEWQWVYSELPDYISLHCSKGHVSTILTFSTGALCIRISAADSLKCSDFILPPTIRILSLHSTHGWENVTLQTKVHTLQSYFTTMIMIKWIILLLQHNMQNVSALVSVTAQFSYQLFPMPMKSHLSLPPPFSILLLTLSLPSVDQTLQLSCSRWLCSATRTPTMHRAPMWEASTGNNMISTYTYTSISPALLYIGTVHLHIILISYGERWTEHLVKIVGNNLLELCSTQTQR